MIRTLTDVLDWFPFDGSVLRSRRAQVAILLAVIVLTAGCLGGGGDGDGNGSDQAIRDASTVDSIPADVDGVASVDGDIVRDETTEELMNGFIDLFAVGEMDEDAPTSWDEALEEMESESDLEIDDFDGATVFFTLDEEMESDDIEEQYGGVIVESQWTWEDIAAAADDELDEADVESDTYNAVPVYIVESEAEEEPAWVADFQDGTFAIGTEDAVKDVIDTRQGDASPFSGELREAYEEQGDALMKGAVAVPEQSDEFESGNEIADDIELATMRYTSAGSELQFDVGLTFGTTESAEEAESLINLADMFVTEEEYGELATLVENIEATRDENHVDIGYTITTDEILNVLEYVREWIPAEDAMSGVEFESTQAPQLAG